jgi:tol-pal system protein YbgF
VQLNEAIKALNTRLDASDQKLVKGLADQKLVIDGMVQTLSVVREGTQDTNSRIRMIADELDALRTSLPSLLSQAAPAPSPVEPADPNAPAPSTGIAPPPLPSTLGLSPNRMFDQAKADFYAGQFPLAITGFEQFLKAFPQSTLAGDAQFFIGEANSSQNKWPEAIAAYNQVIQSYPSSSSVPSAYYKRGQAQQRLGQTEEARMSWEAIIKNFPSSEMATLAKQRLDNLARESAQQRPPG